MTKETERKQVRADEAAATVRDDQRLSALERERVIDLHAQTEREAATKPAGETPFWWQRIKRYFDGI